MTDLLPVSRILENEWVLAFHHPAPGHKVHILIVPKQSVSSLLELSDGQVMMAVLAATRQLVRDLGLEDSGYRLIVNGGRYQEVGQLHFHLVSDG